MGHASGIEPSNAVGLGLRLFSANRRRDFGRASGLPFAENQFIARSRRGSASSAATPPDARSVCAPPFQPGAGWAAGYYSILALPVMLAPRALFPLAVLL